MLNSAIHFAVFHLGMVMIAASKNSVKKGDIHICCCGMSCSPPCIFVVLLSNGDFTRQLFLNTVLEKSHVSYLSRPFPFCICTALVTQLQQLMLIGQHSV